MKKKLGLIALLAVALLNTAFTWRVDYKVYKFDSVWFYAKSPHSKYTIIFKPEEVTGCKVKIGDKVRAVFADDEEMTLLKVIKGGKCK